MKTQHIKQSIFATCICLLASGAQADNSSYLRFETTSDNNNNNDYYLSAGLELIQKSQLQLSYGKSDAASVTSNNYSIGLMSDPLAEFSAGVSYLYWEQAHELETRTYQLSLMRNTDDWSVGLSPQLRTITIYPLTAPSFDTNSTGLGLNAGYYGAYPFFINAAFQFYNYERNVTYLNSSQYPRFTMRNFSMSTLDQANGLEDNRFTLNIGYVFDRITLGYHRERSQSAVDNVTTTTNSIYGSLKLTNIWQLGIEAGKTEDSTATGNNTNYTSFSITYNW